MKKYFVIGVAAMLLLTACGSTKTDDIVCTGKIDEEGVKAEATYYGYLKDGKVASVDVEMEFDSAEYAKQMCSMYELVKTMAPEEAADMKIECDGKKLTIEGMVDEDFTNMTKEEFAKKAEEQGMTCK